MTVCMSLQVALQHAMNRPGIHRTRSTSQQFVVAVPSYKRAEVLAQTTLPALRAARVPPSAIYVFVADDDEKDVYEAVLPQNAYRQLVVGHKGIGKQRTFITHYFSEGTRIFMVDDDIKYFMQLTRKGSNRATSRSTRSVDLPKWINKGFQLCEEYDTTIFGLYPLANEEYMRRLADASVGSYMIIGCAFGVIASHDKRWFVLENEHEDIERTLQHLEHEGQVVRLNIVGYHTKYMAPGGIRAHGVDRSEDSKKRAEQLIARYPQWLKPEIKYKAKYGWYNPQLRRVTGLKVDLMTAG